MCTYIRLGSVSRKTQAKLNALRNDGLGTQPVGYVVDPKNPQRCYFVWNGGTFTVQEAGLGTEEDIIFEAPPAHCQEF